MSRSKIRTTSMLFHIAQFPFLALAQTDLGGTGSFNTSTIAALYGLALAAVSVGSFPVINLSSSNELYARLTYREQHSELFQLRWYYPAKRPWMLHLAKWNSPCILFNGLGAGRVVLIATDPPSDSVARRGGAWVCLSAQLAFGIAGARAPAVGKCGGKHIWCSSPGWWAALGLQPFQDDSSITAQYLRLEGCSRYNKSSCIQDWGVSHVVTERLRVDTTYYYYTELDGTTIPDKYRLPVSTLGTVLNNSDNAIVSTLNPVLTAQLFWGNVCAGESASSEEKELSVISQSYQSWTQTPSTARIVSTRQPISSAVIPLLVETGVTMLIPWFGVTSLVIIEQISRKAVWASLCTGNRKWPKSVAYGGTVEGELYTDCSYILLLNDPPAPTVFLAMSARSFLVLASYAAAVYVQVARGFVLPTHDDILSARAARVVGVSASATHLITTLLALSCLRRIAPCVLPILSTLLVICITALNGVGLLEAARVAPAVLAAEFASCMVQTMVALIIAERIKVREDWYYTVGAIVAELRVPLIVAVPRFVMGNGNS